MSIPQVYPHHVTVISLGEAILRSNEHRRHTQGLHDVTVSLSGCFRFLLFSLRRFLHQTSMQVCFRTALQVFFAPEEAQSCEGRSA